MKKCTGENCPMQMGYDFENCAMYSNNGGICNNGALPLRRPPQSWCYVGEG